MFPARAGMSRGGRCRVCGRVRVPRASGDEPHKRFMKLKNGSCSPRERG